MVHFDEPSSTPHTGGPWSVPNKTQIFSTGSFKKLVQRVSRGRPKLRVWVVGVGSSTSSERPRTGSFGRGDHPSRRGSTSHRRHPHLYLRPKVSLVAKSKPVAFTTEVVSILYPRQRLIRTVRGTTRQNVLERIKKETFYIITIIITIATERPRRHFQQHFQELEGTSPHLWNSRSLTDDEGYDRGYFTSGGGGSWSQR